MASDSDNDEEFQDPIVIMSVTCPRDGCNVVITADGDATRSTLLQDHIKTRHRDEEASRPRPPPIPLPKLAAQCSEGRFAEFERKWAQYKRSVDMPPSATCSFLLECCETDLQKDLMAANITLMEKTEVEVMAAIKTYAVQSRAQCSFIRPGQII